MFNRYPYTNFHELNLDYFIQHFNEIFTEWEQLYNELQSWKTDTTEELAQWRADVESDLNDREAALRAELEIWKQDTEDDISDWETATLNALDAWKTAATAQFEAIRVQAQASADAATAAQTAAETARADAQAAQAAAEAAAQSILASAAQIQRNTDDIRNIEKFIQILNNNFGDGIIKTTYGKNMFNKENITEFKKLAVSTGEIANTDYPSWFTSDYIRVYENETYVLRQANTAIICFYDATKKYLNSYLHPTANNYTFTAPTGAYYVRFSMLNSILNSEQLETGNMFSEYENYELKISNDTHLNLTTPVLEIVRNAGIIPVDFSVYNFAYLKEGVCVCNDKASGTTAKYIGVNLEQDVISAGIKFGFTGTSGDATVMLITSKLGCDRTAHITKGSCHWAVTRNHVLIEYFDNASQTILTHEHIFANPLDFNTEYSFKWAVTHPGGANRVNITYPDDETELINDTEFWTYNGQYLIFELFYTNSSACRPYYTGWYAHGDGGGSSADQYTGDNFMRHEFSDYENTGTLTIAPTGQTYHLFSNEIWGGTPL